MTENKNNYSLEEFQILSNQKVREIFSNVSNNDKISLDQIKKLNNCINNMMKELLNNENQTNPSICILPEVNVTEAPSIPIIHTATSRSLDFSHQIETPLSVEEVSPSASDLDEICKDMNPRDFQELMAIHRSPPITHQVWKAFCIIFHIKVSTREKQKWDSFIGDKNVYFDYAKKHLLTVNGWMQAARGYINDGGVSFDQLSEKDASTLLKLVDNPSFDVDKIFAASHPAGNIAKYAKLFVALYRQHVQSVCAIDLK